MCLESGDGVSQQKWKSLRCENCSDMRVGGR